MAANSEARTVLLVDPARWVDRYGDALLRFALSRIGRRDVAEDLVQETFLSAWKARDSYDGRAAFGTWLCSILRRRIADYYRSTGRHSPVDEEAGAEFESFFTARGKWREAAVAWNESPDELAQRSEFWAVFAACLGSLPVHLAEAFQLRELRQSSIEEACAATGCTPKNLSVRLHRARLSLRRCLDQKWFRSGA
ncbi:MAG: sigma-70 family RNA polymerase sigma factor [Pirellulales bacterium]